MAKICNILLLTFASFAWISCSPQNTNAPQNSEVKIVDNSLVDSDLLKAGDYSIDEYDYDSGAIVDRDVLPQTFGRPDVKTDIRGRLYLPQGNGPFPVVVFLHGNHATCGITTGKGNPRVDTRTDFTISGHCPNGYVESPSHLGYEKSAKHLASWGYAVISINANRGITGREGNTAADSGLIYARGKLVLRHLEEFYKWTRDGRNSLMKPESLDLQSKLDFSRVGLMGHSRGGEGVRYAYNIFANSEDSTEWQQRIPGMRIAGIFEIGPVDMGANSGKVEARGTAWNVLIPGCDSDVYDFAGVNPFARMLEAQEDGFPKSVFTLWGANHNFFNSEWQVSDAPHSCIGEQKPLWDTTGKLLPSPYTRLDENARAGLVGSKAQINVAEALLFAFFQAHLSSHEELLGHIFDPQYRLPGQLSALGSSSREYLSGRQAKLIFDGKDSSDLVSNGDLKLVPLSRYIKDQLASLTKSWQNYADTFDLGHMTAVLLSTTFARPALVIEGDTDDSSKDVTIPLNRVEDAKGYWTLDLSLALRKECYDFDKDLNSTCPELKVDSDFDVSLVLADGSETEAVNIKDYISLDNWYNQMLSRAGTKHANDGTTQIVYEVIPILYQTARFELTDFGKPVDSIKAIKLHFPQDSSVSLVLESARLSKRP